MRYDRARNNLDRHPNYILAAYIWRPVHDPACVSRDSYPRETLDIADERVFYHRG
jgi:hypothetical protein